MSRAACTNGDRKYEATGKSPADEIMRPELEEVVGWCVAPLDSGPAGGTSLEAMRIDSGASATAWHEIVAAFKDTRTADWNRICQAGLTILREESKDYYALWAVLYPMKLSSKRMIVLYAVSSAAVGNGCCG